MATYVPESRPRESRAESFAALAEIALREIKTLGSSCVVVCGPITTGGRGSVEENVRAFQAAIQHLRTQGQVVFDQMPYEPSLWTLKDKWQREHGSDNYCWPLLLEFYLPLYRSGFIVEAHFLPGWESSTGARWEREQFSQLGVKIIDFPVELINQLLLRQ